MPSNFGLSLTGDGRPTAVTDWNTGDLALDDMATGQLRRLLAKPGSFPGSGEESALLAFLRSLSGTVVE